MMKPTIAGIKNAPPKGWITQEEDALGIPIISQEDDTEEIEDGEIQETCGSLRLRKKTLSAKFPWNHMAPHTC